MARTYNYDDAVAASSDIEMTLEGEAYTFPGEAPINVAIEWMQIQNDANLGTAERMQRNYALIFGEVTWDLVQKARIPFPKVDRAYRDLLHEWGLWRKPTDQGETLVTLIERLRNAEKLGKPIGEIIDGIEQALADPASADVEEEVPAGGD